MGGAFAASGYNAWSAPRGDVGNFFFFGPIPSVGPKQRRPVPAAHHGGEIMCRRRGSTQRNQRRDAEEAPTMR